MFERIIVAFDATDTAVDGLLLSMALAKALGSQLAVVYVYDEELAASSRDAARELAEHAEAVLASAREHLSQALAVESVAVQASSPAAGLHELARREGAGLIVIGSRRLGPHTKAALGTVSEGVLRAAPCAVAVAPRGYRRKGGFVPQRIMVGWIPAEPGNDALEAGCRIARATGGSVEVVTMTSAIQTVQSLEDRARRAVHRAVESLGGKLEVTVQAGVGKPTQELISRSRSMDLVVLGSRGYGPPRTMLFGSVSSQVVPQAHCPVLILASGSR
jgi:nucleotide-binding universal stress UspA family protein